MRLTEKDKILISARRRNAGAPIMGDGGGVVRLPPVLLRPQGLTFVVNKTCRIRFSSSRKFGLANQASDSPKVTDPSSLRAGHVDK